jgi:hypothetical protein
MSSPATDLVPRRSSTLPGRQGSRLARSIFMPTASRPSSSSPYRPRRSGPTSPATSAFVEDGIRQRAHWPVLKAALRASAARDVDVEVAAVVGEMFDLLSRERPMIWLLDRCAWELPRLRDVYVERARQPYFDDVARYVRRRRSAPLGRRGEQSAAIGRAVVEMVAWMAMHRARDPAAQPFDTAAARHACIVIASGGLLGTSAPLRR